MVYLMLAEGFEEIEALTVVDILRRGGVAVNTVSINDDHTVCGAHGIKVESDMLFNELDDNIDMIVLPGGMPGTKNLDEHSELKSLLVKVYNRKKYVAAICAAPMILGKLGILEGKKATCYPSFETYLHGAELSLDNVCIDNNVITSRGPGTASDFAMCLLELLVNKETKDKLYGEMIYE